MAVVPSRIPPFSGKIPAKTEPEAVACGQLFAWGDAG
jgi:hypothetical protein